MKIELQKFETVKTPVPFEGRYLIWSTYSRKCFAIFTHKEDAQKYVENCLNPSYQIRPIADDGIIND